MPRLASPAVLLVAHLSPPSPLIAARRVHGLTKYLARLGHDITVLTSAVSGEGPIEGAAEVIRTRDLMATRLNWRRRHFEALTEGMGGYQRPSHLQSVVVPDLALISWLPFALSAALRLASKEFDCVLTTSPPESAHVVGRALKRRRGLPWIAELRDGWTFEPPRAPWPLGTQRALDARLERRALTEADRVVGVTAPIVGDLAQRLGVHATLLTNGFDPEEEAGAATPDDALLDPERHSFVHTGRIAMGGASVRPLLDALRLLENEPIAERLEVVLAGPLSAEEQELLVGRRLVRAVGTLEHSRALELQRAADTLLVVTEGARRRSVTTGKLYEYLAARRPILVLGEETEAARIVGETGAGVATSADDPGQIAHALETTVVSPPSAADPELLRAFSWEHLALRYRDVIEDAINLRRPGRSGARAATLDGV